jgi:hypothetical protein
VRESTSKLAELIIQQQTAKALQSTVPRAVKPYITHDRLSVQALHSLRKVRRKAKSAKSCFLVCEAGFMRGLLTYQPSHLLLHSIAAAAAGSATSAAAPKHTLAAADYRSNTELTAVGVTSALALCQCALDACAHTTWPAAAEQAA